MRDTVRYGLPFGVAGELARRLLVAGDLKRIFDFRAAEIARLLAAGALAGAERVKDQVDPG